MSIVDLEVHQVMSKIKGYIITLTQFPTPEWAITHSKSCTDKLIKSIKDTQTEIEPIVFRATEYKSLKEDLKLITYIDTSNLEYTYPMLHEGRERITGLYMMPPAPHEDVRFRIACMISHMRLWQKCIDMDEPIVVLEYSSNIGIPNSGVNLELGYKDLDNSYEDRWFFALTFNLNIFFIQ